MPYTLLGLKVRLNLAQSNVKQRLATLARGRLRHLLKIGQPLINNFFFRSEVSNRSQSLRLDETFCKLLTTSNFVCFASSVNAP